ncbi:MAG: hypothetical protein BWY04_00076 [candidate division CPR1 bacterium ADurb.Bin160]|uniref:Uncharacterized protein n=1 Tax=candidate division CPR1 bacterium ADurb.Bin160 TaxID=1852826 RepID=A0A1V5ZQM5_9BACT|nr:MAG: hypothetical protein BWY04_00076 [candidate division CPR1 bacterium ADurb.Bin160]
MCTDVDFQLVHVTQIISKLSLNPKFFTTSHKKFNSEKILFLYFKYSLWFCFIQGDTIIFSDFDKISSFRS